MESQITVNYSTIILTICGIVISAFGFFIVRIVKGYDSQVSELFERTKDLPAIRESIEWLKCEVRNMTKKD